MKGKLIYICIIPIVILAWYFFLKTSDHTFNFSSKSQVGTINQSLKLWGTGLKNSTEPKGKDFHNIYQTITYGDTILNYQWKISPENDSLSRISVKVKDLRLLSSLYNRLTAPFFETDFIKKSKMTVMDFMQILKEHTDNFKVTIKGVTETPDKTLAYVTLNKKQYHKAKGMMENTNYISEIILKNGLELDGFPMIEVVKWNQLQDSLTFNFGFPIKMPDKIPDMGEIKVKTLKSEKALKAIFNGNYISSDRAWYSLLNYAEKNNLRLKENPIEVFHNNPHMGGNSLEWVTEVYLPLDNTTN